MNASWGFWFYLFDGHLLSISRWITDIWYWFFVCAVAHGNAFCRLLVLLEDKTFIYDIDSLSILSTIDTVPNPKGKTRSHTMIQLPPNNRNVHYDPNGLLLVLPESNSWLGLAIVKRPCRVSYEQCESPLTEGIHFYFLVDIGNALNRASTLQAFKPFTIQHMSLSDTIFLERMWIWSVSIGSNSYLSCWQCPICGIAYLFC